MDIDRGGPKEFKIVLIGSTGVGKTSLVTRFTEGQFCPQSAPTAPAAFVSKVVPYMDSEIRLNIWDTGGSEQYRSLAPLYFQGAAAGILVYDLTCSTTFYEVDAWLQDLRAKCDTDLIVALVANKTDLAAAHRAVSPEEALGYATGHAIHIFSETSACTGDNVTALFSDIVAHLARRTAAVTEAVHHVNVSHQAILRPCCRDI